MAHFTQAFWSNDYAGGLGVLFGKLQQGVQENRQILTIARMRADAEDVYGQNMSEIGPATDQIADGFSKDDGASVRKAYDGLRTEMEEASRKHRKIASNIRELVVFPFGQWCEQHATRVQTSQDDLQGRVKAHDRQAEIVRKLRSQYFNKCRLVEDLEEEDKLAFKDPNVDTPTSPKAKTPMVRVQTPEEIDEPEPIQLGDVAYRPEQLKKAISDVLSKIHLGELKMPIIGTYTNVSTGAEIVEYIQENLNGKTVSYAERIGQDLVSQGFLRLVGSVGSTFANSSRMNYQWRPKSFLIAGLPEKKGRMAKSSTILSTLSADTMESPIVGAIVENLAGWNPLNNPHPNETPSEKLRREAKESDEKYKAGVRKLDVLRCTLEEAMMEHFKFMERCELDRLKAVKSVILDFSGALSNVIPSLQSTVDKMMLFQETVQPLGDLRYLLENYRTGSFVPRVQIYENYYNSVDDQTFGVDLEARARNDRKRVPLIVTTMLTFLDNHYPLLDGDEARRAIWLVDVPLGATHRLRSEVNDGKPVSLDTLERFEVPIVASLLKLYLLELPDAVVSSTLYEVIKTIYSSSATADSTAASTRISVLQNTLSQLRLANIATLDAIITHFARLIDLTSADQTYISSLAQTIAPCILRPRTETTLSFEEKYNHRFLRDLLAHKDAIFGELKRSISLTHSASILRASSSAGMGRPRAVSSDESNRRAHMEERARAIANKSRNPSPTPAPKDSLMEQHRKRDSSRGPETRFPVNVPGNAGSGSPVRETREPQQLTVEKRRRDSSRGPIETRFPVNATPPPRPRFESLPQPSQLQTKQARETPGNAESDSPVAERTGRYTEGRLPALPVTSTGPYPLATRYSEQQAQSEPAETAPVPDVEVGKSNSLGRSTATPGRYPRKPGGASVGGGLTMSRQSFRRNEGNGNATGGEHGSFEEKRPVGVELVDAPMDD